MKNSYKVLLTVFLASVLNCVPSFAMEHLDHRNRSESASKLTEFYRTYLDREPGSSEIAHYADQLEKNRSLEDIATEIANSPEAQIRRFYKVYLNRKPDSGGLTHYLWQVGQGRSLEEIGQDIACSEEARKHVEKSQESHLTRDKTIVSLGWRCTARFNIITHYYGEKEKGPTNFFDWVFSASFDEVIQVLSWSDEEFKRTFNLENLDIHLAGNGYYGIRPKNLKHISSIHDVAVGDEWDKRDTAGGREALNRKLKEGYIDVYTRRFHRLIERIKEPKPIFFIRWSEGIQNNTSTEVTEEQIARFQAVLEKISPGNRHYLVNVGSKRNSLLNVVQLESRYRFKYFDLSPFPKIAQKPKLDWTFDDYDWLRVFRWIESVK